MARAGRDSPERDARREAPDREAPTREASAREAPRVEGGGRPEASTAELVRAIATDLSELTRKELELARHEVTEAVRARALGAGMLAAAGIAALLAVVFLALAGASALDRVLSEWLARLVVGGGFLLVAGAAALAGRSKLQRPPLEPEETKRTVKEDIEWAKTQLRR